MTRVVSSTSECWLKSYPLSFLYTKASQSSGGPKPWLLGQLGGIFQLGWVGDLCSVTDSSSWNRWAMWAVSSYIKEQGCPVSVADWYLRSTGALSMGAADRRERMDVSKDPPPQTYARPTTSALFPASITHWSLRCTNGWINNIHRDKQLRKISQRLKVILSVMSHLVISTCLSWQPCSLEGEGPWILGNL